MYHVIINGHNLDKKALKNIDTVKRVFDKAGKEYTLHITDHAGHAKEIAQELTADGQFAHLIAMGGDGTLHEVLNGIQDVENCTLGLIPVGSGNDFAQAAHIPLNVTHAAETIAFRAPSAIDFIELSNGLRSINAVGTGIDVDVLKHAYARTKAGKKTSYFSSFVKVLRTYKATSFTVRYDGREERHTGLIACVGNGKQFGGSIKMFPGASIDDGFLDLIVVDYLSKIKTVFAFLKLVMGRINHVKEVLHVKCSEVSIIPDNGLVPIQAEGEIYENVTLDLKLVAGKLKFYLPEND